MYISLGAIRIDDVFNKSVFECMDNLFLWKFSGTAFLSFRPYLEITGDVFYLHAGLLTSITHIPANLKKK